MKPKGVSKRYSTTGLVTTDRVPVGKRRGNNTKGPTAKSMKEALLVARAVKMRIQGHNYNEIAVEMGISSVTARNWVIGEMEKRRLELAEDIDVVRQLELTRLDELYVAATEPLTEKPAVIPHPMTGVPQLVKPDKNEGVKTALKVMERRARLLGMDSGNKFDGGGDAPTRVYIGIEMDKV